MTDPTTPMQSTLDLVDFETVRDDGVIETAETYTRLIELTPRPWLTASDSTRDAVYTAFTQALRGLRFPLQFLTYTSSVPIDEHLQRFEEVHSPQDAQRAVAAAHAVAADRGSSTAPAERAPPDVTTPDGGTMLDSDGETPPDPVDEQADSDNAGSVSNSPILAYGRLAHAQWLDQAVRTGTGRDRQYFVAVAVRKDGASPASRSTLEDIRYTLRQYLPVQRETVDTETEQQCLAELRGRARQVASSLPKTGVETEMLTNRPSVLEVLYQYYHAQPASVPLDHSWLTRTDRDPDLEPDVSTAADAASADTATDGGDVWSWSTSSDEPTTVPPDMNARGDGGENDVDA